MNDKLYNVGTYIRLSRENTAYADGDSMSIENQQAIPPGLHILVHSRIASVFSSSDGR